MTNLEKDALFQCFSRKCKHYCNNSLIMCTDRACH